MLVMRVVFTKFSGEKVGEQVCCSHNSGAQECQVKIELYHDTQSLKDGTILMVMHLYTNSWKALFH